MAPGSDALVVVLAPLQHRCAGQLLDVARPADVVGMHVRDDDLLDRRIQLVQHGAPLRLRLAGAEPGVHEDPPAVRRAQEIAVDVVDPERQRERDPTHSLLDNLHA